MSYRLTDTWLRNVAGKAQEKDFERGEADGFGVRVRKSGAVSFIFRPVLKSGKQIKMTLGKYPAMSLKEARELADGYRKSVEKGLDPRIVREGETQANLTEPTLTEVFMFWYDNYALQNIQSAKEHLRSFELHVQDKYGGKYYKDISRKEFLEDLMTLVKLKPAIGDRVLTDLKAAIDYARTHHRVNHPNFLEGVQRKHVGIKKQVGERALEEEEIALFFLALHRCAMSPKNKLMLRMLMYYGCRGIELRKTVRDWVNLDEGIWTIPWSETKTKKKVKKPLSRPISSLTAPLWEEAMALSGSSHYLFTNMKNRAEVDESPVTASALLNLPFTLQNWVQRNIRTESGEPFVWQHWSNHDIRRTARTFWYNHLGGEWSLCERMLGHVLPGETETYDKGTALDRMLPLYTKWWEYLANVERDVLGPYSFQQVWRKGA